MDAAQISASSFSVASSASAASIATSSQSTTTSHSSVSTSPVPTSSSKSSSNRLSNGAVAGIVIAVALGLAVLTFLATFLIMRRQQHSKGKRRSHMSKDSRGLELSTPRDRNSTATPTKPLPTQTSSVSEAYEPYLPQSADDRTVQQKAKSTLDQIELHIENFYRNSPSSAARPDDAGLALFNSPYLPAPLASLLPRSKNRVNIMKHALAQSVTSSISPSASTTQSLLPPEYANTVTLAKPSASNKAGEYRFVSSEFTDYPSVADTTKGSLRLCLDGA